MQSTIYHNVLHNKYPVLTMVELVHVGDQLFWEINFLCPQWKGSTFNLIHDFFLLGFERGWGEGIFLVFNVFPSCSHYHLIFFPNCLAMVQLPFAQVVGQGGREAKGSMIKQSFVKF